jgi:hypothetical protein
MTTTPNAVCRICRTHAAVEHTSEDNGLLMTRQSCPTCGEWKGALDIFVPQLGRADTAHLLPYLAAHIRQSNAAGVRVVELTEENWREAAEAHARTSIRRRLDLLLRWFQQQTKYAGEFVRRPGDIYPLVDAQNDNEVAFLTSTLVEQGLLNARLNRPDDFQISAAGWDRLHPTIGGAPGTCFVAMSFAQSLDTAFDEGIVLALNNDCGYDVDRVDRAPHNDNITDRILAGIRSAQFVVADFTLQRQGVYYEAGFAQGLGRTVIRTCRDTDFDNLHFDTRQFFHLKWSTPADLRTSLADHVLATVGAWRGR